jgi:ADP-ribosylglycohydrolase
MTLELVRRVLAGLAVFLCALAAPADPPPRAAGGFAPAPGVGQLEGFWLGLSLANWTGLITEMDRVEPPFYTDADWGTRDHRNIWGQYVPHSRTIDFYSLARGRPWGADDDSDMEYLYLHLMHEHASPLLSAEQIRDGWIRHIYSNADAPIPAGGKERENFLWVSNERALELMLQGGLPPATSNPAVNPDCTMIDAQLTTELFGLLAPGRPDVAWRLAELPIRTTACAEAADIARFYVTMHALAATVDAAQPLVPQLQALAHAARANLPEDGYPAQMYDFVWSHYQANPDQSDWESTRDAIYRRYQWQSHDGYVYRKSFDAGINFAASLVSLFYGHADFRRTVQIGALAGWDSDNPTATWGGLLGYLLGKDRLEAEFPGPVPSDTYWIHRTRRNFPDHTPGEPGEDRFRLMAERMLAVIERVEQMQSAKLPDAAGTEGRE